MLRRLVEHGLECSYILVSAASFIMREVCEVTPHGLQDFVQKVCPNFNLSVLLTSLLPFLSILHMNTQ